MRLKELASIKTNQRNADFWIIRRGSINTLGDSTRTFNAEYYGLTVIRTDLVISDWLFYMFKHLNLSGYFYPLAKGTLELVHITKQDIENIKFK